MRVHLEASVPVLAAVIGSSADFAQPRDRVYLLTLHLARHLFLVAAVVPTCSPDPGRGSAKRKLLVNCRYLFCCGQLRLRVGLVAVWEITHLAILAPLEVEVVAVQALAIIFWLCLWEMPRRNN